MNDVKQYKDSRAAKYSVEIDTRTRRQDLTIQLLTTVVGAILPPIVNAVLPPVVNAVLPSIIKAIMQYGFAN